MDGISINPSPPTVAISRALVRWRLWESRVQTGTGTICAGYWRSREEATTAGAIIAKILALQSTKEDGQ